ncbi:MAG TPA: large conductance mechanosensitive channel protein MscL [Thermoplasmata archaeon]|nr:large conductance mechanosensitive channel protein MscL [Thermoplasmata archaeon]
MSNLLDEFKAFITRGNVIDLAVAVVVGLAFNAVIMAFVADLITPLIGVFFHSNLSTNSVKFAGSTFLYGDLLNHVISFLIIAAVVFFLLVKPAAMLEARRKANLPKPPATRECPYCLTMIPEKARKCSACASSVDPVG